MSGADRFSGAPATEAELDDLERHIDGWLDRLHAENPAVEAVDRGEPDERRWYVRMAGESKSHITAWLSLRQRALHVEVHVVPAPEENRAELYEYVLRRNASLVGLAFCIGDEDAIYLRGHVPVRHLDEPALDRVLGAAWAYVEHSFRTALRLGFASRLEIRTD